jgi:hypothetical protein
MAVKRPSRARTGQLRYHYLASQAFFRHLYYDAGNVAYLRVDFE